MSEDRKTLRELLAGGGRHLGAALAGMFTYPIIARLLDDEALGAWALLGAAAFFLRLTDFGLNISIQRAAVAHEYPRARRLIALTIAVIGVSAPVVAVGVYFFVTDLPADTAPELVADARRAAVVAILAGMVTAFAGPYRALVYARGGIRYVANAQTIASVLNVCAIICGFIIFRSLLVPACALLVGVTSDLLLTLRAARKIDPAVSFRPRLPPDRTEIRDAFRDGAAQLAINLSTTTALRVDLFVLVRVESLAVVAAYGVAGRAIEISYSLAKQATIALVPRLGDPKRRARAVRIGLGVFTGVIFTGMAALSLNGQELLIGWVGDVAAGPIPALVLILLASGAVFIAAYELPGMSVMLSAPSGWSCAIPIVIGSALNLVISISGASHYGVWAVAGSTIIGNALTFLLMWRVAGKLLSWRLPQILSALSPGLAGAVAGGGVALALRTFSASGLFPSILSCVATFVVGVGMAAVMLKLTAPKSSDPAVEADA